MILYVDDERPNRIVFEQSLKHRFAIKCVGSGEEALEVLQNETIAVIVSDQRMAKMTGNELLEIVREKYPTIVRVVITAYDDIDPIMRAVNDGLVARYLVKPWNLAEVEEILAWGIEAYWLGERNSELQKRLIQTERLVTLGSIGGAVIHDLRQPLAYMSGNVQRLQQLGDGIAVIGRLLASPQTPLAPRDLAILGHLAHEFPPIVQDLHIGCTVIDGITESLRRMLRADSAQNMAGTEPLPIIRYALSTCQEIAVRARGSLVYDGPDKCPVVAIDSVSLTQVLINLVANAAQAIERRATPDGRVVVTLMQENDGCRITVRDNGPGMCPEVMSKIGTPFFSTRSEGTGLGVAQCRRLIYRVKGEMTIDSALGKGTTVSFWLPSVPTASPSQST